MLINQAAEIFTARLINNFSPKFVKKATMQKFCFTLGFILIAYISTAQTSQTTYYKDENLKKEVPEEKAVYKKTITQSEDGTITVEAINIIKQEVIFFEATKNSEQVGVWINPKREPKVLNYDFQLIYSKDTCINTTPKMADYFKDNDSLQYKAPKITSGEQSIFQYIGSHTYYPRLARDNGIEGTIYLTLIVDDKGKVSSVSVNRGIQVTLDKEAARVLNSLTFDGPATLIGVPVGFCCVIPIKFMMS